MIYEISNIFLSGASIIDGHFITEEGFDNKADLIVEISKAPEQVIPNVPEPGTVISLLAVSGLGLGLRRKKQG